MQVWCFTGFLCLTLHLCDAFLWLAIILSENIPFCESSTLLLMWIRVKVRVPWRNRMDWMNINWGLDAALAPSSISLLPVHNNVKNFPLHTSQLPWRSAQVLRARQPQTEPLQSLNPNKSFFLYMASVQCFSHTHERKLLYHVFPWPQNIFSCSKTVFVDNVKGLGIRSSCMRWGPISVAGVLRREWDAWTLKTEAMWG